MEEEKFLGVYLDSGSDSKPTRQCFSKDSYFSLSCTFCSKYGVCHSVLRALNSCAKDFCTAAPVLDIWRNGEDHLNNLVFSHSLVYTYSIVFYILNTRTINLKLMLISIIIPPEIRSTLFLILIDLIERVVFKLKVKSLIIYNDFSYFN